MVDAGRQQHELVDPWGVHLTWYSWSVPQPRAVIQLAHGLGDHALRYEALAQRLVAVGYTVVADDHRGHGATGLAQWRGDASRLGRLGPGGLRAAVAGVRQLTAEVRQRHPDVPIVLLGQSWGSLMAQMILNADTDDYAAAVLTGTAFRTLRHMNSGDLNARHRHLGVDQWLSRDPDAVAAFGADPLTFIANVPKLFGYADGLRLLGRPSRRVRSELPILLMVGSDDSLGGERSVRALAAAYRRVGVADVETVVYPDARHEIFNETNRDEVVADLLAWLDAHLEPAA